MPSKGTLAAYSESSWSPDKGRNNGKDMQWGGGTLFVDREEKQDKETGGRRKLSVRTKVSIRYTLYLAKKKKIVGLA